MAAGNEAAHGTYKGSISLGSCTGWKDWILELSAGGVSNLNTTEVIVPTCSDFEDREYQDVYEGTWSWSGESGTPLTLVLKNQETGNVKEVVTPAFSVGEPIKVEQSGKYAAAAVTRLENPLVPPEKQAAVDALIKAAVIDTWTLHAICCGKGWAIHAILFEWKRGTESKETGNVMDNDGNFLDVSLADARGRVDRRTGYLVDPADQVVRVSGHACDHYLCYSLTFHLASGKTIEFEAANTDWRGASFEHSVPDGSIFAGLKFASGECIGLELSEAPAPPPPENPAFMPN